MVPLDSCKRKNIQFCKLIRLMIRKLVQPLTPVKDVCILKLPKRNGCTWSLLPSIVRYIKQLQYFRHRNITQFSICFFFTWLADTKGGESRTLFKVDGISLLNILLILNPVATPAIKANRLASEFLWPANFRDFRLT